jgi:CRISPR-associated protein Cas1
MRERKHSGGGGRRRKGGDEGPDLFAQQVAKALDKVVAGAFATTAEGGPGERGGQGEGEKGRQGEGESGMAAPAAGKSPTSPSLPAAPSSAPEGRAAPGEAAPSTGSGPSAGEDELAPAGFIANTPKVEARSTSSGPSAPVEPIQARMLNEFVYCPRLFYYEYVDGVFVESADTLRGAAVHARVDKGASAIPKGKEGESGTAAPVEGTSPSSPPLPVSPSSSPKGEPPAGEEVIHRHSVTLGSERLGVIAKMDLVDVTLDEAGGVAAVCPVDYKAGSPREGAAGLELWDTDRMQLGLQCLVLRENGYRCAGGIIYYRGTKQRVPLELTPELEAWVGAQVAEARRVAAGPIPPPLIDSPKCVRCSLAPVCLPDETRMLSIPTVENFASADGEVSGQRLPAGPAPRRLIAQRDERRALYLNTPGFRVGCNDAVLKVKEKDRVVDEVRVMDVCHVALFGNIQISTQAVQRLCEEEVPVTYFSMGGWFYGITRGHSLTNVLLRIEQFRHAADPLACLRLAKQFVRGKIHNHRVMYMRNHVQPAEKTKLRLGQAREDALATRSLEELLGVEGAAAAVYFQQFGGLICEERDDGAGEGAAPADAAAKADEPRFKFDFATRNRRPPTDPVNALLSLAYSLLAKECTLAACAVGLDPYVGFYHQPRHGRPALALDIMEEFRPIIAESAVVTAINNRCVSTKDFVTAGHAVNLSTIGRKKFFKCFEERMGAIVTHPVFDYKVSYRRALELQFRILARVLMSEIPEYVPFVAR